MRWACILLPQLALDATLRQQADPDAPLALVGGPTQRRVLHAVNPAARGLGLRRGMLLSAAHALTRDFHALPFDPRMEAATRQMLAAWAYGFSSQVSLAFAHALVLEIAGSRALFGEWPQISRCLSLELADMGFRHRLSAAPDPVAARVLAHTQSAIGIDAAQLEAALAAIPVERSGLPMEAAETLHRSGLRRLGQVFAVARESLARRFPPTVLAHLDALRSHEGMPLPYFAPPAAACALTSSLKTGITVIPSGRVKQISRTFPLSSESGRWTYRTAVSSALEERRLLHGILDRSRLQARQLLRGRHALSITQADPACTRRAKARRMSKGSD